MKFTFSTARIAIVATVILGLLAGSASATQDPIPGVDIIVKKNPGGRAIKATTDKSGQFNVVVKEPGQYSVSIVRKAGKPTQDEFLVTASGTTLKKSSPVTYEFTVGREPVTLRGKVSENDSPRPVNRSEAGSDATQGGAGISATYQGEASFGGARGAEARRSREIVGNESPATARIATAPGAPDGDKISLPGKVGDPIPYVEVGLEGDPDGARVGATTTDKTGAFRFGKVPAGKYKLVIAGQPDRMLSVGADGVASGKVMRGEDGRLSIFDRWGKDAPSAPVNTSRSNKKR